VSIVELRDGLSRYPRKVRQREEMLLRHRKTRIARIVPVSQTDRFDEETLALAAKGLVRLPEKSWGVLELGLFRPRPGEHRIPTEILINAVITTPDED
jgi:antitoxin (DNA-binding transcriptional repressor) of toxin-antitoxin stability system